jgi:hypothetical protein
MSFFPPEFDPRADVVGALSLVNINTPDGDFGFLLGSDGIYGDVNGKAWHGAVIAESPKIDMSINGIAPAGQIGMGFFQDPDAPDLIGQIRALGVDYVRGRRITFYVVPMTDLAQLHAPVLAPIPLADFEMRSIEATASGPVQRRLSLSFEGAFVGRNTARGWYYTTADHAKLTGAANPSLTYAPMDGRQEEKLF